MAFSLSDSPLRMLSTLLPAFTMGSVTLVPFFILDYVELTSWQFVFWSMLTSLGLVVWCKILISLPFLIP